MNFWVWIAIAAVVASLFGGALLFAVVLWSKQSYPSIPKVICLFTVPVAFFWIGIWVAFLYGLGAAFMPPSPPPAPPKPQYVQVEVICDECHGTGKAQVPDEWRKTHPEEPGMVAVCPMCGGDGKLTEWKVKP